MIDDFDYDVFVSYRSAEPDRTWVRTTLMPRLKHDGLRSCVDYDCFRLGEPLVTSMEKAVTTSRYTLAIMTPAYLQGPFATFERVLATHLELEQQRLRFVVAMREPSEPPLSIRYKLWLDMTDDSTFDETAARLCAELHRPLDG